MKDDLEDIPMSYLWYAVLAIIAIVATAGGCGPSVVLDA